MSKADHELALEGKAELFKALGHPVRLLILNLVQRKPRHGEELAAILSLNPATISHHLSILSKAGLLKSEKDQYYQTYSLVEECLHQTLAEAIRLPAAELSGGVEEDAYRSRVMRTFFKHGRLVSIPAQLKKQQIVLEKIVQEFEPGRSYSELEVNHILLDFHEDVATLRRGLVAQGLLEREHGIYCRKVEDG